MDALLDLAFGFVADRLAAGTHIEPFGLLDHGKRRLSLINFRSQPTDADIDRFIHHVLENEPQCARYAVVYEARALIAGGNIPPNQRAMSVPALRPGVAASAAPGAGDPVHAIFVAVAARAEPPQLWRAGVTGQTTLGQRQNVTDRYEVPYVVAFPALH